MQHKVPTTTRLSAVHVLTEAASVSRYVRDERKVPCDGWSRTMGLIKSFINLLMPDTGGHRKNLIFSFYKVIIDIDDDDEL